MLINLLKRSRHMARQYQLSWPKTAWQMLNCRLKHKISARDFGYYRMNEVPESEWGNFVSKQVLTTMQWRLNEAPNRTYDKLEFAIRCERAGVPAPRLRAVIHASPHAYDGLVISTKEEAQAYFDALTVGDEVMVKPIQGALGQAVRGIRKTDTGLTDLNGRPFDFDSAWEEWHVHRSGLLIQDRLSNHPDMNTLMPGEALGTTRIVTTLLDGEAKPLYAFAKAVISGNEIDNYDSGATGNMLVGLNLETGCLLEGYRAADTSKPWLTERLEAHPETKLPFPGTPLPRWQECLDAALLAAHAFPEMACVGWDVAYTTDGAVIIEGNPFWDPDGPQMCLHHGMRRDLRALLKNFPDHFPKHS